MAVVLWSLCPATLQECAACVRCSRQKTCEVGGNYVIGEKDGGDQMRTAIASDCCPTAEAERCHLLTS